MTLSLARYVDLFLVIACRRLSLFLIGFLRHDDDDNGDLSRSFCFVELICLIWSVFIFAYDFVWFSVCVFSGRIPALSEGN